MLSVRALSEREQRGLHRAEAVLALGLICLFVFPVMSLASFGMHFEIGVWHGLLWSLPVMLLIVGVRWLRRFPEPICLRYGAKGVCLNDGERWSWERVQLRCSMQGNSLGGHTRDVGKAEKAILWLQLDGQEPVRLVTVPDNITRSSRGRLAHPLRRFRHELGSLLGWLPADAVRLIVSRGEWEEGQVFRPLSINPDWLIYLFLTSALCALFWCLGEPGQQSTAVCGAVSWLCLAAALLMWHSSLDEVVVCRQGIRSRRHGLIRWDEIGQLRMPDRWVEGGSSAGLEQPPPGRRRGFRTNLPIVILETSRLNSQPIVWKWMDWPPGWRGFSDFRAWCEEGRLHFAPEDEAAAANI